MNEKLTKEEMIKIEKHQMERIKAKDLTRRVLHTKGEQQTMIRLDARGNPRDIDIIGMTKVEIYKHSELSFVEGRGFDYSSADPISVGMAFCSASEGTYNKRIGRIIATGRAIRKV